MKIVIEIPGNRGQCFNDTTGLTLTMESGHLNPIVEISSPNETHKATVTLEELKEAIAHFKANQS